MNKRHHIFKKILLAMIFMIMFLHLIVSIFKIGDVAVLKGYIIPPEKPALSDSSWFSENYQIKETRYINATFGFRNLYVRLHNQIDFSLFNKVHSHGVVIGKENYLFEERYINSYYGKDFMGKDSVEHILNQVKYISSELSKMGKQLIIVFSADKASFYPEFIPDRYVRKSYSTNYALLSASAKKTGINVIDFNKWFMDNKLRSEYPLYPQYGTHWSNYGAALAADSMINYIQNLRHIDMPNLIYDKIDLKQPIYNDYDIADGLNLLFRLKSFDMAYAKISTENSKNKIKPGVLVISDSFYWDMFYFGISKSFKNDQFWYYNKQVYTGSDKRNFLVKDLDLKKELDRHDVFIVMAAASNLNEIGWGFFDNVEAFFKNKNGDFSGNNNYQNELNSKKQAIKGDPDWMKQIEAKAKQRNITLDSMLTIDAIWLIENRAK